MQITKEQIEAAPIVKSVLEIGNLFVFWSNHTFRNWHFDLKSEYGPDIQLGPLGFLLWNGLTVDECLATRLDNEYDYLAPAGEYDNEE